MIQGTRTGITTGACAAAGAKAAAMLLLGRAVISPVNIPLPDGHRLPVPVLWARLTDDGRKASAAVRKDAGDDPDVTHGLEIITTVWPGQAGHTVFLAGERASARSPSRACRFLRVSRRSTRARVG